MYSDFMFMRWATLQRILLSVILAAVSGMQVSYAAEKPTIVVEHSYPNIVDATFVAEYATIPPRDDAMIIDSRPEKAYQNGHIVPAVNIPDRKFDQSLDLLPKDKSALLIYYCGGLKCPLSHNSAFKAEKQGYTNVRVYAAGYPDWLEHGHFPGVGEHYVRDLLESGAVALLVDARPVKKFMEGSVPGAINIPYRTFDQMKGVLPADKGVELIFFCGGYKCPLSPKSAVKARELGYTNVKLFQGGYPLWQETFGAAGGMPVGTSASAAGKEGIISIEKFTRLMREDPDSVYWVDVRDPMEVAVDGTFRTKTAMTIPMDKLEAAISTLPTDKPLVFFCANGILSADAYDVLREKGSKLEAYYLEARVEFFKQPLPKVSPLK